MKTSSVLGIDLGGTKTALALFDAVTLERRAMQVLPTHAEKGYDHVRKDLFAAIDALRAPDTVAIGLGVPGLVEVSTGRVRTMPNIPGSEKSDLRSEVEAYAKLPTIIDNDARCFAYAEAMLGAGKGHDIVIGITLGTGVGGGIVIHGKLLRGAHGFAGEVGHMLLVPGEPPYDTENRRGEVEQFLSGTAMGRRCTAAKDPKEYLEGEACGFMQPRVYREVAWLVTSLTHAIDPSIIVFGGSAGRALKHHLKEVEAELAQWLLAGVDPPELACGILDDAALRGAALLALLGSK